jgi:hypothetical protein
MRELNWIAHSSLHDSREGLFAGLRCWPVPSMEIRDIARCRICNWPLSQHDCATSCPDRVLAREFQQLTVPITARNSFFCLLYHRFIAECNTTKACISWNKDATLAGCPLWGNSPCHQRQSDMFYPPARPPTLCMKRQIAI